MKWISQMVVVWMIDDLLNGIRLATIHDASGARNNWWNRQVNCAVSSRQNPSLIENSTTAHVSVPLGAQRDDVGKLTFGGLEIKIKYVLSRLIRYVYLRSKSAHLSSAYNEAIDFVTFNWMRTFVSTGKLDQHQADDNYSTNCDSHRCSSVDKLWTRTDRRKFPLGKWKFEFYQLIKSAEIGWDYQTTWRELIRCFFILFEKKLI